jgi:hypothetical protein
MSDQLRLIDTKVDTMEVTLMSLIQAIELHLPGVGETTVMLIRKQAAAAERRGDRTSGFLLSRAADTVGQACDLSGFEQTEI